MRAQCDGALRRELRASRQPCLGGGGGGRGQKSRLLVCVGWVFVRYPFGLLWVFPAQLVPMLSSVRGKLKYPALWYIILVDRMRVCMVVIFAGGRGNGWDYVDGIGPYIDI